MINLFKDVLIDYRLSQKRNQQKPVMPERKKEANKIRLFNFTNMQNCIEISRLFFFCIWTLYVVSFFFFLGLVINSLLVYVIWSLSYWEITYNTYVWSRTSSSFFFRIIIIIYNLSISMKDPVSVTIISSVVNFDNFIDT